MDNNVTGLFLSRWKKKENRNRKKNSVGMENNITGTGCQMPGKEYYWKRILM